MAKDKQKLRVPPQNIDSEKALLGSIMLKPTSATDVLDFITEESFYIESHRLIFQAISELAGKGKALDILSLSSRLEEKGVLEKVGGRSYLTETINTVPSSANMMYYAEMVYQKYTLRQLIEASDYISELGFNEKEELTDVLDKAEKRVFEVTGSSKTHKFISLKDGLSEAWERLEKLHESSDELRGVPTGFKDIDNKLSGFQKSDLIILAARPSMGKTSLALDIARQAATKHNMSVGVFSMEMSAQQLVDRMLAADSRVDSWKLRTGKLNADTDFSKLRDSLDMLSKAPIYIDDEAGNTVMKMRSVARRLKSEKGLDLIIVDYLQLIHTSKNYDSMVNQVTEISRALKGLARELNVPVLALSQLSRAVESRGGPPRLSDLRDSGSIEQDADVVMFIHRDKNNEDYEKRNITDIMIEKHRNGPVGTVQLYFDEQKTAFLSVEKNKFEDINFSSDEQEPEF